MRLIVILLMLVCQTAWADPKIQSFIPGLERELAGCVGQVSGNDKVAARAAAYVKTDAPDKADAEKDAAALAAGAALYKQYCDEVAGFVAYLKDQAKVPYKSVEREIDTRDNKLRQLRRDAKKSVEELAPTMRKWIAKVVPPVVVVDEKRTPGTFPSGRVVELPGLGGVWKVGGGKVNDSATYEDKGVSASLSTTPLTGTCEDLHGQVLKNPFALDVVDVTVSKDAGITWAMRYTRKQATPSTVIELCVTSIKISARAELTPATSPLVDDMTKVLLRMVAARAPKK
ncbi:MAG: hypothetical protein ABI867_35375 [Kofleriaceae bacterium]